MSKSGIYSITNNVSGRVYVGSAVNIKIRWNGHKHGLRTNKHSNRLLQNSWNKHGEGVFIFAVIETVDDVNQLITREQFWIDKLDSANARTGFNLSPTAGSVLGIKRSDETRELMRNAKTEAHRAALAERNKSEEMRAIVAARNTTPKMRAVTAERNKTPEMRAVARNKSPETLDRLAALISERNKSLEMRAVAKRKKSPETREKMRIAALNRWVHDESGRTALAARNKSSEMRAKTAAQNKTPEMRAIAAAAASSRIRSKAERLKISILAKQRIHKRNEHGQFC